MLKLDALQEKPWYVQLAVFGGVALVVYGAFWYFVTSSTRAETREVEAKVESLLRANAGAVVASQRLNEFKANYERARADYEDLKLLLPEQFEGHPLRKDFALMTREAKPWPGATEGEEIDE